MTEATKNRVLTTAGPIFAEKGFDGATVREICSQAEVNVASVNYHFGDKETLYLEVVQHAHRLKTEQVPLARWSEDTPPEEKLRMFIRVMLERMLGRTEVDWATRLLMREMIQPTIACQSIVEQFIRPQNELLREIIDELLPALPPDRRHKIAFSVVGQCLFYRVAREFVNLLIPAEQREESFDREQLLEHITEFTLAAIKNLSPSTDAPGAATS